ncbi:uncharacterized protein L199_003205 [Kwoniella botswanensis]|uniref:uncharacterized protein n=1 Tax=Kwoniella botswanensis TaxID=1268659 RepID=UPI00315C93F2
MAPGRFNEETSVLSPQGNPTTQHRSIEDVSNEKPNTNFKASFWSRCHDRWFFVAFIVEITLYFVLSVYAIFEFSQNYDEIKKDGTSGGDRDNGSTTKVDTGDIDEALTGDTTYMLLGATGLALILNFLLLFFIRKFPEFVIWSGPVMAVIFCLAAAGEKSESWYAFKKASSTSLGSVAFGSLLVELVETLALIIKTISLGLCGSSIFTCCCFCIINIIEGLLELFNKYVYVKIGVDDFQYGFIPSAKEIIHIVKKKKGDQRVGLNAMITDCLVGFSLHTTCIACAIVCTGATYVYTIIIDGTAKVDDWWDWLILVYSFILALNIGLVLTSALEAGVSTILICLDKDPSKLKDKNPRFYDRLKEHEAYGIYRALLDEEN